MPSSGAGPELLTQLPPRLAVGGGLVLPLLGRAAGAGAVALRAGAGPWTNAEVCGVGADGRFWALLALDAASAGATLGIAARVTAAGSVTEVEVARVTVDPPSGAQPTGDPGRIAICLPAHEPDGALLRAQLESLRAQTHTGWVCLIDDDASSPAGRAVIRDAVAGDPRFVVREHDERAGVYRNVERALRNLPQDAGLVALCDQDDRWAPDKLERLAAALHGDPRATLAHSDLRIVDRAGAVLAPTAWTERRRSEDRLRDLVTANTVTGAASLLRRAVLADALPFPVPIGPDAFHDHWLALTAAATGAIAYVDAPLVDYVQHEGNVLGHRPLRGPRSPAPRAERWRASYAEVLLYRQALAMTLLLRCGARMAARDRREVTRTAAGPRAPLALAARAVSGAGRPRRTLGHEWRALRGALWLAQARRAGSAAAPGGPLDGLVSPAWPTGSSSRPSPSSG